MMITNILRVARFELTRESNKRSLWFVIVLMILPLLVSILVKQFSKENITDPYLWATIMGFRGVFNSQATLSIPLTVIAWGWLIAILFGGDLFASDIEDSSIVLILSRPISRLEYILGKILASTIVMIVVFYVGGLSVFLASWILAGSQHGFLEMSIESVLVGIGAMPLLLLTAIIGVKFRKPVIGYVLGFVAYFIASIASGIIAVYYFVKSGEAMMIKVAILVRALIPIVSVSGTSSILYSYLHPDQPMMLPAGPSGETIVVNFGYYFAVAVASLIIWIGVLILLSYIVLRKMDL